MEVLTEEMAKGSGVRNRIDWLSVVFAFCCIIGRLWSHSVEEIMCGFTGSFMLE